MGERFVRQITVLGEVPSLGPVMLYDDMEDLLKWTMDGTAGDPVFEKSTTVAYNKAASLHIKSTTAGASADDLILATRSLFQRPGKRYRFEVIWRFEVEANLKLASFLITILDGTHTHRVRIQYDPQNHKWIYEDSNGNDQDVPDGAQNLLATGWHRFSMEWDQASGKYGRFISDSLSVDLSAVGYEKAANGTIEKLDCQVGLLTQQAAPAEAHYDDFLIVEI